MTPNPDAMIFRAEFLVFWSVGIAVNL